MLFDKITIFNEKNKTRDKSSELIRKFQKKISDLIMSDAVQDRHAISQQMDSTWAYLYFYFISVTLKLLYLPGLNMSDTVQGRYAISQQQMD